MDINKLFMDIAENGFIQAGVGYLDIQTKLMRQDDEYKRAISNGVAITIGEKLLQYLKTGNLNLDVYTLIDDTTFNALSYELAEYFGSPAMIFAYVDTLPIPQITKEAVTRGILIVFYRSVYETIEAYPSVRNNKYYRMITKPSTWLRSYFNSWGSTTNTTSNNYLNLL